MVCYEAGVRGWCGFNRTHIDADSHFKDLIDLGVHFYDTNASSRLLFNLKPGTLERFHLTDLEEFFERDDANDFIEFEAGDGGYEGVVFDEDDSSELDEGDEEDEEDEDGADGISEYYY